MGTAEFWANLLRPISSSTAVTPTLATIKIVTPLSVVMTMFTPAPINTYLFILGALPVALIVLQIAFLTVANLSALESDPHKERMRELEGLFGENSPEGNRKMKVVGSSQPSENPQLFREPAASSLLGGGK
jgi:hypothetical protein